VYPRSRYEKTAPEITFRHNTLGVEITLSQFRRKSKIPPPSVWDGRAGGRLQNRSASRPLDKHLPPPDDVPTS
jgi:hypothetical protein